MTAKKNPSLIERMAVVISSEVEKSLDKEGGISWHMDDMERVAKAAITSMDNMGWALALQQAADLNHVDLDREEAAAILLDMIKAVLEESTT